ncbi:Npt1/Npt2 family nucleotide transporter [Polaribacter sp. Asnod6-C07]|uniref:Npt1/Npt2 family nucleotide transporter n=1 Tax=Polaribacter sp. Asnod6-C07 TaxID=3160582 RepID=UPI0038703888
MKKIIYKTFGLRDGEIFISFLMQLYIFLIITVLLIVKPTVNAMFVSKLGAENLPYGYLLVAITAVFTTYFYSKAIRKHSLVKITVLSLIVFSAVFIVLGVLFNLEIINQFILYFYYVFVSLFAVVATSQFWIFANMVFNAREAKRIFGFIGAGAIAGGIFGGYLTSIIAASFGKEYTIFLASILLLLCIPILNKVYYLRIKYLNTFKRKQVIENQDRLESSSLKLISKSKHLSYLAIITGISVVVAKLIDFQFSDFANKAISNSDDLAAFFGFWFSTFNVVALTIQLLLTNKILNKIGVSSSLLVLPLTIGLGSLLFLTFPELWVLIIIKGIDGSFKQSLNKAAVELSIMPIPLHIKNQAKSYIDVAVDSIATGFSGFLLIFFIKELNLSSSYITVIVLLFVFIWILLIYKLREAYFDSFKKNIQKNLSFIDDKKEKSKKENNLLDIKNVFENGNEEEILAMFDRLKDYKFKIFQKPVIQLLKHPSSKIKVAAIDFLDAFDDNNILDDVVAFIYDKDETLVYVALDYVLEHSNQRDTTFFNRYLDHQEEYIANGALLALAKQSKNNYNLGKYYHLKNRLELKIDKYIVNRDAVRKEIVAGLLLSIAYSGLENHYGFIAEHLKNQKPYIIKFATIAAGITSQEIFIKDLLNLLDKRRHRKRAIRALKSYGPKIINVLLSLEKEDDLNSNIRKQVPKIVGAFQNEKSVHILEKILKSVNSTSRLEATKALRKIHKKDLDLVPSKRIIRKQITKESGYYKHILESIISIQYLINKDLVDEINNENQTIYEGRKILSDALEQELKKSFSIIFNLLSLLYSEEDIQITFNAIKSNHKEAKINSLELLENLLDSSIKALVVPILEHEVLDDDHYNTATIPFIILTELELLKKLMKVSGSGVRQSAVNYIRISKNKTLIPALLPIKKYRNKIVKQLAYDTLKMLRNL